MAKVKKAINGPSSEDGLAKESLANETKKKVSKSKPKAKKSNTKKKSSVKKTINPDNYFYLANGNVIKDLMELVDAIDFMSTDIYYHHVNDAKNDFANWIENVFEMPDLAKELIQTKEPAKTQVIILKHMVKTGN